MANYGDGPLTHTFPCFLEKVDFTIYRTSARRQVKLIPWWDLKGIGTKGRGNQPEAQVVVNSGNRIEGDCGILFFCPP